MFKLASGKDTIMEPSSHTDKFILDNMPSPEFWPEMDYTILPELSAYPARLNAAVELMDKQVEAGLKEAKAIIFGDKTWTYQALMDDANRIANVLVKDYNVVPGERILIRSGNHPILIASWLAILKTGAIAITTMPVLRERELIYMIKKAKIRIAISHYNLATDIDNAKAAAPELEAIIYFEKGHPDSLENIMMKMEKSFINVDTAATDPAIIGFTSGSTGTPKGTIHFHRDILAAADCFIGNVVKIRKGDVVCGSPQIAFLYGLCAFIADTFRFGATAVLLERGTPEAVLETIEKHKATVCFSTPSGYKLMIEKAQNYNLSSLRECVGGGEPLLPSIFNEWKDITGVEMINGLGISELLHIFISASGKNIKPGAIGKAIPGFQVRVVNDNMEEVKPGEIGQMIVKGPNGCRYLDDQEKQQAYIKDGWNLSGDLCRIDSEGYLYYEARTDDMILTGGYNVSGLEVEAVLLEHPNVKEAAVVGSPDKNRGQVVKAFIILRETPAGKIDTVVDELQNFVKSEISAFKYPRKIEFVKDLPLTATGKIQRGALRKLERERFDLSNKT